MTTADLRLAGRLSKQFIPYAVGQKLLLTKAFFCSIRGTELMAKQLNLSQRTVIHTALHTEMHHFEYAI